MCIKQEEKKKQKFCIDQNRKKHWSVTTKIYIQIKNATKATINRSHVIYSMDWFFYTGCHVIIFKNIKTHYSKNRLFTAETELIPLSINVAIECYVVILIHLSGRDA